MQLKRLAAALALLFACAASLRASDLRLLAPAHGEVLAGGSTAVVEWSAGALDGHVEEWEAFLSVDGGAYYGVRITPHLDSHLRRFAFTVPNVAARDARILIRVGDEHREQAISFATSFAIRPTEARVFPFFAPIVEDEDEREARDEAEAARPGDEPVWEWVSGDREGHELARRARQHETSLDATSVADAHDAAFAPAPEPPATSAIARITPRAIAVSRITFLRRAATPPGRAILLQTRRLNV
ncbi:MAG TPA: hypothetical protein VFN10_15345 [Thermoanaerobaculia bacterium]|nr:hypothetical protein [Thermoanaerobaculia bacterium]